MSSPFLCVLIDFHFDCNGTPVPSDSIKFLAWAGKSVPLGMFVAGEDTEPGVSISIERMVLSTYSHLPSADVLHPNVSR